MTGLAEVNAPAGKQAISAQRWRGQLMFLAIGFAIVILVSALSFFLINQAQDAYEDAQQSLRVQHDLVELQIELRRAEAAQRAYLIAQQQIHIDRYREAMDAVPCALEGVLRRD